MVVNPHIYSKMSVNLMQDLVPVVTTISNQLVLAVNPQVVPVNDFPAFVEFARKPATPLFYASIGNGSHHHLAMEMLKQRAGIDLTHVPYKGGGPASIAVISGENALMFGGTSVVGHIKNGKLKALAVSGSKGWPTMPDLPAIGEFYPGYKSSLWHGIFAPKGTPPAILDKLRAELNAVLADAGGQRAPRHWRRRRAVHHDARANSPPCCAPITNATATVIQSIGFKVD